MASLWTFVLLGWFSGAQVGLGVKVPLSGYDLLLGYSLRMAAWTAPHGPGMQPGVSLHLSGFAGDERYRVGLWALGPMVRMPVAALTLELGAGVGQITRFLGEGREQGTVTHLWGAASYRILQWPGAELALDLGYQLVPGRTHRFHTVSLSLVGRWLSGL